MDNNIYNPPKSNVDVSSSFESIKKPRGVLLIGLWMLLYFGVNIYGISLIASQIVQFDFMVVRIITLISFLVLFVLVFGVLKPISILVKLTAFVFIAYGTYQVYLLIMTFINSPHIIPVQRVFMGIIPSFICSWYLLGQNMRNYLNCVSNREENA